MEVKNPNWKNWTQNLLHNASNGTNYYFVPKNLAELKSVLGQIPAGATLRVSGQRHSQPPLVASDQRSAPNPVTEYLVDMSCYSDLGLDGNEQIVMGPGENQVTVNSGIREDEVDIFLQVNNRILNTVTAGGFFSIGGMTAVDVHGGTIQAPIFAETASAFNVLMADGSMHTITAATPGLGGFSALDFIRVSLGGLGIVTSIVIDVQPRPYANTFQGSYNEFRLTTVSDFKKKFAAFLASTDRAEIFYTPYAADWIGQNNFFALSWKEQNPPSSPVPNPTTMPTIEDACQLAGKDEFGAPYLPATENYLGQKVGNDAQYTNLTYDPFLGPAVITKIALDNIKKQATAAMKVYSDLWLAEATEVIFMSYFVPLSDLGTNGMAVVWEGLDYVRDLVVPNGKFHISAPMEFRFIKGGNSAMSSAYSGGKDMWFVNFDLIGFVPIGAEPSTYNSKLLEFFSKVERKWVSMNGLPHNGKMYGFYDPTNVDQTSFTPPFNPNYISQLRQRKNAQNSRVDQFRAYRAQVDPKGLFYNSYLRSLLGE